MKNILAWVVSILFVIGVGSIVGYMLPPVVCFSSWEFLNSAELKDLCKDVDKWWW